jgi:hypothetical protein
MPRFTNLTDTEIIKDTYPKINTGFANFETDVNAHFSGSADNHDASDIVNDSTVTGARVDDALNDLQNQIDSISTADSNATIGVYSVTATGTNTLAGSVTGLTYFGGLKINLKIENNNTGAVTFNLNALGAKNLRKLDGTGTKVALEPRDLLAGKVAQLEYDGTDFILINAKDVATYSAEQTETVEVASLPNTAVEGEVDAVVKGTTVTNNIPLSRFDSVATNWGTFQTLINTTSADKVVGSNSVEITMNSGAGGVNLGTAYGTNIIQRINKSKHYFVSAYFKNVDLSGGASSLRFRVNNIGGIGHISSSYTTSNSWERLGLKLQPSDFVGVTNIIALAELRGVDGEKARYDALMFMPITQAEHDNLTVDQLLDKYPYVNDIKHVEANRVKVVGKNLFDGKLEAGSLSAGVPDSTANRIRSANYIKIEPNKQYTISNDKGATSPNFFWYDMSKSYISVSTTATATSPANAFYCKFKYNISGSDLTTKVQIEQGSTATTYEPYTETTRYFDKSLKSLPNGTKDTIDNNGLYTKRLSDLQDITGTTYASIDTATYTDVDVVKTTAFSAMRATTTGVDGFTRVLNKDGVELSEVAQADIDLTASVGKYYVHTDKTIWFIVADGTYADVDGARTGLGTSKVMFELATPTTEQLALQPLQSQANGTIYNEPITKELLTYDTGLTLTNDLRLADKNFIESLYKVDGETKTPIALADVTVASATSLTISGANDDEQYEIVYEVELGNSTRAELTYSYPLDNVAQLDDVSKITFKTNKELRDFINYQNAVNVVFDARITAVEP